MIFHSKLALQILKIKNITKKSFLFPFFNKETFRKRQISSKTFDTPLDLVSYENGSLETPQLFLKYGYNAEVYTVLTNDGYVLQLHRIPRPGGKPFLLQHGLIDSSAGFAFSGPKSALSFYLSDLGYDVWLGNTRGNRYSNEHLIYKPEKDKSEFWNFNLTDVACNDLKAIIDFILKETKYETLNYVGHSTGSTILWILCSLIPTYNKKISLMHAMAPVAYLNHISKNLKNFLSFYCKSPATFKIHPLSTSNSGLIKLDDESTKLCLDFLFAVAGPSKNQLIPQMLPTILGHYPAGCSSKEIEHLLYMLERGELCDLNPKWTKNELRKFDLSKVSCPVILYYSKSDFFANPDDVQSLKLKLGNCFGSYVIEKDEWSHYDFIFGRDSRKLIYKEIIENCKKFEAGVLRKNIEN